MQKKKTSSLTTLIPEAFFKSAVFTYKIKYFIIYKYKRLNSSNSFKNSNYNLILHSKPTEKYYMLILEKLHNYLYKEKKKKISKYRNLSSFFSHSCLLNSIASYSKDYDKVCLLFTPPKLLFKNLVSGITQDFMVLYLLHITDYIRFIYISKKQCYLNIYHVSKISLNYFKKKNLPMKIFVYEKKNPFRKHHKLLFQFVLINNCIITQFNITKRSPYKNYIFIHGGGIKTYNLSDKTLKSIISSLFFGLIKTLTVVKLYYLQNFKMKSKPFVQLIYPISINGLEVVIVKNKINYLCISFMNHLLINKLFLLSKITTLKIENNKIKANVLDCFFRLHRNNKKYISLFLTANKHHDKFNNVIDNHQKNQLSLRKKGFIVLNFDIIFMLKNKFKNFKIGTFGYQLISNKKLKS